MWTLFSLVLVSLLCYSEPAPDIIEDLMHSKHSQDMGTVIKYIDDPKELQRIQALLDKNEKKAAAKAKKKRRGRSGSKSATDQLEHKTKHKSAKVSRTVKKQLSQPHPNPGFPNATFVEPGNGISHNSHKSTRNSKKHHSKSARSAKKKHSSKSSKAGRSLKKQHHKS